jgi:anti-sigma factor (TIGR02949 family)
MRDKRMSCEQVLEHLIAYLDCELDAGTAAQIDRHLALCRGCFSRAEFERRLNEHLQKSAGARAPDSLRTRIRDLIEHF